MAIKIYNKTDRSYITKNFRVSEFSCKGKGCCSTVKIDPKLAEYLQKIRDHFKKPVTINSGYRCAKHNRAVGGASSSYHAKGQAADIVVSGVKPAEVAKYAESIGIKGIGLYETSKDGHFVHIDTRTTKSFWYGQGQAYRSTFDGMPKYDAEPTKVTKVTAKDSAKSMLKTLAGTYKVTASALNVRHGAGATKKKMVAIPKNTSVKCYGYYTSFLGTKWLYIQFTYKGILYTGFASSKYLKKV